MGLYSHGLLLTILVYTTYGQNQDPDGHADALLQCARDLFPTMIEKASCAGKTCLCDSEGWRKETVTYISATCSISQIQAVNITASICDAPLRDKSHSMDVITLAMMFVTGILIISRIIFKKFFSRRHQLESDDYAVIASMFTGLAASLMNYLALDKSGLGRDIWTMPVSMAVNYARYFYGQQVLYTILSAMVKFCFILFYLNIFISKWSRRLLFGTLVYISLFYSTLVIVFIFECQPISYYWSQLYNNEEPGSCFSINICAWLNGAMSIALDILIIAIPLWQIRKLHLHWKKRLAVAIMFLIGTMTTFISMVRLRSLIRFSNSKNRTWDDLIVVWWSTIELNMGLTCACLPTLRLILIRLWPDVFHYKHTSDRPECFAENIQNTIGGTEVKIRDRKWSAAVAKVDMVEDNLSLPAPVLITTISLSESESTV